jgi:molybdenum cofactor cytidylyltransferase
VLRGGKYVAVEGIILAAGLSSRAKTFKMTLEFNNKTIIENTIDGMLGFCKRIVLVGGHRIENLMPIAAKYDRVELVLNEGFEEGMFSSVLKGLSHIRGDKFFLTPGDYPLIDPEVYGELLKQEGEVVIPIFEGRRGHPILFESRVIKEIIGSVKYSNLREYIRDKNPVLVPVSCRGILMDVDTLEDYQGLLCAAAKEEIG